MWVFKEEEGTELFSDQSKPRSVFQVSLTSMAYHRLLHSFLLSGLGKPLKGTVHHLWAFGWKPRMGLKKAKTGVLISFLLMVEQNHIVCPIWKRIPVVETTPRAPSSLRHANLLRSAQRSYGWKQMLAQNLRNTWHTAQRSFCHFQLKEIMQKKTFIVPWKWVMPIHYCC